MLREKVGGAHGIGDVVGLSIEAFEPEHSKVSVKTEHSSSVGSFGRPIKAERHSGGSSPTEVGIHDAEVARALAEAHKERKRQQHAELADQLMQNLMSTSGVSSIHVDVGPSSEAPQEDASTFQAVEPSYDSTAMSTDLHTELGETAQPGAKLEETDDASMLWTSSDPELMTSPRWTARQCASA
ncbi:hypothetical protein BD414DRAFT_489348 [Trametes punicea]|nr:hypothetical protein BD414DRAFT_489348 [Trametes punicea]